jgi:hypothetical protein
MTEANREKAIEIQSCFSSHRKKLNSTPAFPQRFLFPFQRSVDQTQHAECRPIAQMGPNAERFRENQKWIRPTSRLRSESRVK